MGPCAGAGIVESGGAMVERTREDIEGEKAELQSEFGPAYPQLEALLFDEDPMGINFGENTDEYSMEVRTILPRLRHCLTRDDVQTVVHEEFCRWFGAEAAGPRPRYQHIAARIHDELLELIARRFN
jgi:uncharacterized protein YqkB